MTDDKVVAISAQPKRRNTAERVSLAVSLANLAINIARVLGLWG